ncbi:ester cyclase [Sulfitobacter profundi]|uniref:Ester cyclase n=1 Tax=Sulfitobacter profundi TaxID=2679961 RepID=A0ABW1Z1H3_9RHOB
MRGHYFGTFLSPWLDIPPTGHLTHMRFHEFYRFERGKVVESQAIWDIPEVMMQAGAWPMAPSLGREFCVPGPATQNGLIEAPVMRNRLRPALSTLPTCSITSQGIPQKADLRLCRWRDSGIRK